MRNVQLLVFIAAISVAAAFFAMDVIGPASAQSTIPVPGGWACMPVPGGWTPPADARSIAMDDGATMVVWRNGYAVLRAP